MRAALFFAIAAGCADTATPAIRLLDAPVLCLARSFCNPLTNSGCNADDRCAPTMDSRVCPAQAACVAPGSVPLGGSCALREVYENVLADDCGRGAICGRGACRTLCDPAGGMPICAADEVCERPPGIMIVGACVPR